MAEDRAKFRRGFDPDDRTIQLNPRAMQSMRNERARNFPEIGRGGGNPVANTRVNIPLLSFRQDDGSYAPVGFDVPSTFTSQFDPSRAGRAPSGEAIQSGGDRGFSPADPDVSPMARADMRFPDIDDVSPMARTSERIPAPAPVATPAAQNAGFNPQPDRPRFREMPMSDSAAALRAEAEAALGQGFTPEEFESKVFELAAQRDRQRLREDALSRGLLGEGTASVNRFEEDPLYYSNAPVRTIGDTRLTGQGARLAKEAIAGDQRFRVDDQITEITRPAGAGGVQSTFVNPEIASEEFGSRQEALQGRSFASQVKEQTIEKLASAAGLNIANARLAGTRAETLPRKVEAAAGYNEALARQADATAASALMPAPPEPITAPMQVGTDTTGVPIYEDRAFLQTDRGFQPFEDVIAQPQPGTVEGFRSWARRQLANPENAGATQTELLEIYRERFPEFPLDGS